MVTSEQRSEIARRAGRARAQMPDFLEHQRQAGKRSAEVNDMAALGRKGFRAAVRKGHDYARLWERARQYRLDHPSKPERQVIALLAGLGLAEGEDYEREYRPFDGDLISVDFAFPARRRIVEVNGKVHYDPLFESPKTPHTRAVGDGKRLERLQQAGWLVLVLDYRELDQADKQLRLFLEVAL